LAQEAALQKCVIEVIQARLVDSVHDCSEGGIAVALAESGFHRDVGVRVKLTSGGLPPEYVLFGEEVSRIAISCDPQNLSRIQQIAVKYGVAAEPIGETAPKKFEISVDDAVVVSASVSDLKDAWQHALQKALHVETEERLVPAVVQRS
jgi:phosphoribosylformylglycinamidine synthase